MAARGRRSAEAGRARRSGVAIVLTIAPVAAAIVLAGGAALATPGAGSGRMTGAASVAYPTPGPPVLGQTIDVAPVAGQVLVKLAGGHGFVPLTAPRQIPVGSTLDTVAGTVRLTTATSSRALQAGDFNRGVFMVLQNRRERGLTDLDLQDTLSPTQVCTTVGKASATRTRVSSKVLGLLIGNGHGRFTTRGQFSSASVRGTDWGVRNRCDGTLTRDIRGVVVVDDFRLRKTVVLQTGQSYLAQAPAAGAPGAY